MNKYNGLKIANIAGKGADGCGVQRTTAELQLWANKVGAKVDYYSYDKKFGRANGHNMTINTFSESGLSGLAKYINENYDIVMFMNYPSNKHDNSYSKAFYYDFFIKINKPIKAFFEHDIHKGQVDKTPYLVPMLYNSDIVFHFDIDTWFSRTIDNMGIQKIGDRLHKYTLWMNFDELNKWRNQYKNNKIDGLVSVTRWSSLKNVDRSIEIMNNLLNKKPDWDCSVHGIERSIGAKFQILDRNDVSYINKSGKIDGNGIVKVYGPVERNEGINIVANHLFSSSFFSLPKKPDNYGNRMEYTQIEIIGAGTIPVFDKHWAENNKLSDGRRYIDVPYSAIYTDGTNIDELTDKLIKISENSLEIKKYLDTSYNLVLSEFNADIVIPKTIELIKKVGKNPNQKSVYDICNELVNVSFANEIQKLEDKGLLPVLGIGEFSVGDVDYLEDGKQVHVTKIKKSKVKSKQLF